MELSIVSGTYNRLEHLKRMVKSVRKDVNDLTYEIVLVDGGSDDGTIEWCRGQDDIYLIEHGELLGGVKAFNDGAAAAQGEFVVILNDDIELVKGTLGIAHGYLIENPHVAQVAFENIVEGTADKYRKPISTAFGYLYGQCCMTRRHLGNLAGWWGDEGMRTYGGDTRLSMRLWEMGYPTVAVDGCAIVDHVADDELRKINNENVRTGPGHPDSARFHEVWNGRMPDRDSWIPANVSRVIEKAAHGTLHTLRFKLMAYGHPIRTSMINAMSKYGSSLQVPMYSVNEESVLDIVERLRPDLLFLQLHSPHPAFPFESIREMRERYPYMMIINWDGDAHYPMEEWHAEVAREVDLQLMVSPSLYRWYLERGIYAGYWPVGVENDFFVVRNNEGPFIYDITFMGSSYGGNTFPEGMTRINTVKRLMEDGHNVGLYGHLWHQYGLEVESTYEKFSVNADIYAKSRLGLSISATTDLWGYTSDRLYNITATGCPALLQRFAGMEDHGYIDGETCIAWSTIDEMAEKAEYYLRTDNEHERELIGLAGQKMTMERHTWSARAEGLFSMIGGMQYG